MRQNNLHASTAEEGAFTSHALGGFGKGVFITGGLEFEEFAVRLALFLQVAQRRDAAIVQDQDFVAALFYVMQQV